MLFEAFVTVHNELVGFCNENGDKFDCILSGSTATLVYIKGKSLFVAHVGDSRAVIGKMVNGKIRPMEITRDHKPTLQDELERIYSMGGEVKRVEDDIPHRVFAKGREYPGIAMSRTIGDTLAQKIGVVCTPEVNEIPLTEQDLFLLICSDGVWEFISSEEAVAEIAKYNKNLKKAAEALTTLAWKRWIKHEVDVVDDITVVLAYFKQI